MLKRFISISSPVTNLDFIASVLGKIANHSESCLQSNSRWKNLRVVNLQHVEVETSKDQPLFENKLNALLIEKLTMRLKTHEFAVDYENLFSDLKATIDRITTSGKLDSLNPFRKGFEKFKYLDITLNQLQLIKKTDKEIIGSYLSNEIISLHLNNMKKEKIEKIAFLRCGEDTKISITDEVVECICWSFK